MIEVLRYGGESVSVALEEINPRELLEKVYEPDIAGHPERLYKQPGY